VPGHCALRRADEPLRTCLATASLRRDRPVRAAVTVRDRLCVAVLSELPELDETSSIVAVWARVRYTCFYEAPGSIRAHAARVFLGASANAPDRWLSWPTTQPDVHSSFAR
jgi:hypothetical protein